MRHSLCQESACQIEDTVSLQNIFISARPGVAEKVVSLSLFNVSLHLSVCLLCRYGRVGDGSVWGAWEWEYSEGIVLCCFWGDINRCLSTPDGAPGTDQRDDSTEVQLGEPVNFLGLLPRACGSGYSEWG